MIVVSADAGLFVITPDQAGVTIDAATATTTEPQAIVRLDGVRVSDENAVFHPSVLRFAYLHGVAATCATAVGVFEKAIEITAHYITEREQFGKPIATFQGATLKAADAYIDTQAHHGHDLVGALAARRGQSRPSPTRWRSAKFWVADGGQRVAHACQHLHGGIGVDTRLPDPPLLPLGQGARAMPRRHHQPAPAAGPVDRGASTCHRPHPTSARCRTELRAYFGG